MVTRKQIWDTFDEWEGKEKGSSYGNYEKALKSMGIKIKKCKKKPACRRKVMKLLKEKA